MAGPPVSRVTNLPSVLGTGTNYRRCAAVCFGDQELSSQQLQNRLLEVLHQAHPGTVRMKALARSYVWPRIDGEIESWIANCSGCQQQRNDPPKAPPLTWNWTPQPWSRIHVDFAGPFHGKTYLFVVDSHSKWLEVEQVPSMDSREVIHQLARIFAVHGLPDVLVSNNGPAFDSAAFRPFGVANRIRFLRIAPYHPASNGQVERVVRTTKQALRMMTPDKWKIELSQFLLNYRLTPHSATGLFPAKILLRRTRGHAGQAPPRFLTVHGESTVGRRHKPASRGSQENPAFPSRRSRLGAHFPHGRAHQMGNRRGTRSDYPALILDRTAPPIRTGTAVS
ncbi:hypothetical protein M514_08901, partial [Trichuris suis]